jgi:IS30 family transposase
MESVVVPLAHPMRRAPFEQLTRSEREIIRRMLPRHSINDIARALGKHRCTVFRELRRNRNKAGIYYEIQAHNLMLARRRAAKEKYRVIEGHFEVGRHVQELLHKRLSPEQIAGIMRRTQYHRPVCQKTIYRWVHREWQQRKRLLRFKGKPRVPYGSRKNSWEPNKRHISERPFIVSRRRRTGDWEADLVHGTQDDSASCLLTLNDRASGYCLIRALKSRNSENVRREIVLALRGFPVHTITCDNGSRLR